MAKSKTDSTRAEVIHIAGAIAPPKDNADALLAGMDGEGSPAEKLLGAATGALITLAEGGMMLSAAITSRISEIVGEDIDPEQLPALVEQALSRRGGKLCGYYEIDPAYEEALREIADQQGVEISALIQDMMDTAMDNGWLYSIDPRPQQVLMTQEDHAQLESMLGEKFTTGSELAALVRQALGATASLLEV